MKISVFSFLLVMVLVSQNLLAQEVPNLIKILSYNIYHGENPNQPGKPNLEQIADLILQVQPTVIALQEIDSMTARTSNIYREKISLINELIKHTSSTVTLAKRWITMKATMVLVSW